MEPFEKGNFCFFAANGEQKRQTSVCLLQADRKWEVSFPWLANDIQKLTIAVSANVPVYD
jgi:hypothetical protein